VGGAGGEEEGPADGDGSRPKVREVVGVVATPRFRGRSGRNLNQRTRRPLSHASACVS